MFIVIITNSLSHTCMCEHMHTHTQTPFKEVQTLWDGRILRKNAYKQIIFFLQPTQNGYGLLSDKVSSVSGEADI